MTWPTDTVAVVDERRRAGDRDVLGERSNTELEVDDDRLRDAEVDFTRLVLKALDVRDDLVVTRRQRRRHVLPGRVGHRRALDAGGLIVNGHRHARDDGALAVGDGSLKRGGRLRPRGRQTAEKDRNEDREPHQSPSFVQGRR
jgi:hypothetical protein